MINGLTWSMVGEEKKKDLQNVTHVKDQVFLLFHEHRVW